MLAKPSLDRSLARKFSLTRKGCLGPGAEVVGGAGCCIPVLTSLLQTHSRSSQARVGTRDCKPCTKWIESPKAASHHGALRQSVLLVPVISFSTSVRELRFSALLASVPPLRICLIDESFGHHLGPGSAAVHFLLPQKGVC